MSKSIEVGWSWKLEDL